MGGNRTIGPLKSVMPTHLVNLEALILREVLDVPREAKVKIDLNRLPTICETDAPNRSESFISFRLLKRKVCSST